MTVADYVAQPCEKACDLILAQQFCHWGHRVGDRRCQGGVHIWHCGMCDFVASYATGWNCVIVSRGPQCCPARLRISRSNHDQFRDPHVAV